METLSSPRAGSYPARLPEKQKKEVPYTSFLFEKCLALAVLGVCTTLKSLSSEATDFPNTLQQYQNYKHHYL